MTPGPRLAALLLPGCLYISDADHAARRSELELAAYEGEYLGLAQIRFYPAGAAEIACGGPLVIAVDEGSLVAAGHGLLGCEDAAGALTGESLVIDGAAGQVEGGAVAGGVLAAALLAGPQELAWEGEIAEGDGGLALEGAVAGGLADGATYEGTFSLSPP